MHYFFHNLQESFLLIIGAALFFAVGCLIMTTVDSVPTDLVINALILGILSIVTGMVFVLDTCLSSRRDGGKKSRLPKNTRYGDIARTRTVLDTVDSTHVTKAAHVNETEKKAVAHANGTEKNVVAHANGTEKNAVAHANGIHKSAGAHVNGGILKRETMEKNGLLQTAAANGRVVEMKNESVQTMKEEETDIDATESVHQYGRKHLENRGFGGHRHADWFDTDMDLTKMKKLEINVSPEEYPDYRHRYVRLRAIEVYYNY